MIFAGTPHRGSDQSRWSTCATRLATLFQKDHSARLSRPLERGSETLEVLQNQFKIIQNNFKLFTFLEELPVHKIGKIVERDSAVINCESEETRMIHANHMDMVRFDKECNEYKKIKDAFQQIHHQSIDSREPEGLHQRPTLNTDSGSYTRLPGSSFSGNSSQQRLSASQQHETITAEDYTRLTSRRSSGRSSGASSPRMLLHHLTNRASITTIGTVGSGTSRRSGQPEPQFEEQAPSRPDGSENGT